MFPQLTQFTDLSLLLPRLMVAAVFVTSGWTDIKDPKEYRYELGVCGVSRCRGTRRRVGNRVWCTHATRGDWSDSDHAGSDPEEDLCLAHRFLGRKSVRMALRSDAGPDE